MDNIVSIITIFLSIMAFFISIYNLVLTRRKVITEFVSVNRIDWIKDVRELMFNFAECYYDRQSKDKLRMCKTKIDLYTRMNDPAYNDLNDILEKCIQNEFNKDDYNKLIIECQKVLGAPWARMKDESGISSRQDKKMREKFFVK